MQKPAELKGLYRIIDANINRVKEGLRVCEEITRFILDDKQLTGDFKKIRHQIDFFARESCENIQMISQRNSLKDVGLKIKNKAEFVRRDFSDIFNANIQRVKEAIRVLEEFSKLNNLKAAVKMRGIRYSVYELEKKTVKKIRSLRGLK